MVLLDFANFRLLRSMLFKLLHFTPDQFNLLLG